MDFFFFLDFNNFSVKPNSYVAKESFFSLLSKCTVWKFQHFSATQILREINFSEPGSLENAILDTLNFYFLSI